MSDKNSERLEQEAREALVAADLSAKMKQWRQHPQSPEGGKKGSWWRLPLLLLALVGAAWWLWPKAEVPPPQPTPETLPAPVAPGSTTPTPPASDAPTKPQPMAEKPGPSRYLAIAVSNYRAPSFAPEVRGDTPDVKDPLDAARSALAKKRHAEALKLLLVVPAGYETDAMYLRAHALFGIKKYPESANLFGQLTSSMRYGEPAQWYGILAKLPDFEQQKTSIMNRLKEIAQDDGHSFQREAQALEQNLKL